VQRGLGYAAYRARLDPAGAQIVNECLRRDYRWDWQVDERLVYLARQVRDLRLDITPLVEQMRLRATKAPQRAHPTDDDNQFDVAVDVLTALARNRPTGRPDDSADRDWGSAPRRRRGPNHATPRVNQTRGSLPRGSLQRLPGWFGLPPQQPESVIVGRRLFVAVRLPAARFSGAAEPGRERSEVLAQRVIADRDVDHLAVKVIRSAGVEAPGVVPVDGDAIALLHERILKQLGCQARIVVVQPVQQIGSRGAAHSSAPGP
jgi:hypothetical protein